MFILFQTIIDSKKKKRTLKDVDVDVDMTIESPNPKEKHTKRIKGDAELPIIEVIIINHAENDNYKWTANQLLT